MDAEKSITGSRHPTCDRRPPDWFKLESEHCIGGANVIKLLFLFIILTACNFSIIVYLHFGVCEISRAVFLVP